MNGFIYDDGGREAAGYSGRAGDCVCRAIAIASRRPYAEVYSRLASETGAQRASKRTPKKASTAAHGISVGRKWFGDYMAELGAQWVPIMKIGSGCKVHLTADELPRGRLVVSLSGHYSTMIDGVIHDTWDPRRPEAGTGRETRCVYGYWRFP